MIPLVVLDLDGTIVGSSGTVAECVWQAAEKVRSAGVKLSVCTGRPHGGISEKIATRLGPNTPHIFQSGAQIAYADGETLQAFALKEANTRALIEHARDYGLVLEIYTPNEIFVERKTPMSEAHAKMLGMSAIIRDLGDVVENEPVVRVQWVLSADQVEKAFGLELDTVQISHAVSPALQGSHLISVTQKGVSKGSAITRLAEILKVDLANVMALGDSEGDLPMLQVVGHPLVMGNASEALRDRFASVGSVEACGAVEALERALTLQNR